MNLKSCTLPELQTLFKEMGEPAFRAKQVYQWLHRGVRTYSEMTNLSQGLRQKLEERYPIQAPKVVRKPRKMAPSNICGSCLTETAWKRC